MLNHKFHILQIPQACEILVHVPICDIEKYDNCIRPVSIVLGVVIYAKIPHIYGLTCEELIRIIPSVKTGMSFSQF